MIRPDLLSGMYMAFDRWRYVIVSRDYNTLYCRCWDSKEKRCMNRRRLCDFHLQDVTGETVGEKEARAISKLEFLLDTGELGGEKK
jgi:hypothetical protein